MKMLRFLATLALALACGLATAQSFPSRPVTIVVPFAAGGTADAMVRAMSPFLSEMWGQPVIVKNIPGAGNILAARSVAGSPADGYTLLLAPDPMLATNPLMYANLSYDPAKDFAPVTTLVRFDLGIAVHKDVPAKNLKEFVELARSPDSKLNYGSFGPGTAPHLVMELLNHVTGGVHITHVPYKGLAPVFVDLFAGRIQASVMGAGAAAPSVKDGRIRMLAVGGDTRSPMLPDVPTFAEAGFPKMAGPAWWGIVVPAGTPSAIIDRLNADLVKVVKNPAFYETHALQRGYTPVGNSPAEFAQLITRTTELWRPVIKAANIRLD